MLFYQTIFMNENYELLIKIENRCKKGIPPIVYSKNLHYKKVMTEEELNLLLQEKLIEVLEFPKSGYKKAKITEKGYLLLRDYESNEHPICSKLRNILIN